LSGTRDHDIAISPSDFVSDFSDFAHPVLGKRLRPRRDCGPAGHITQLAILPGDLHPNLDGSEYLPPFRSERQITRAVGLSIDR
jgi:hypothetical protein